MLNKVTIIKCNISLPKPVELLCGNVGQGAMHKYKILVTEQPHSHTWICVGNYLIHSRVTFKNTKKMSYFMLVKHWLISCPSGWKWIDTAERYSHGVWSSMLNAWLHIMKRCCHFCLRIEQDNKSLSNPSPQ